MLRFPSLGTISYFFCLYLIVFEVITRKLFSCSLQEVDEIGGYVVAIAGTCDFAYAQAMGAGLFMLDFG